MVHMELGRRILDDVVKDLADIGTVEVWPRVEGRTMTLIMIPKPQSTPQAARPAAPSNPAAESHPTAQAGSTAGQVDEPGRFHDPGYCRSSGSGKLQATPGSSKPKDSTTT